MARGQAGAGLNRAGTVQVEGKAAGRLATKVEDVQRALCDHRLNASAELRSGLALLQQKRRLQAEAKVRA